MARSQSQSSQREGGEATGGVVRRQSPRKSVTGGSAPVLSGGYLQRHTSKNDLVKRLRNVVEQLQDPAVEPNSPDFPGLGSLSNTLVADQYINHRDKDVRLHTVLACMEIFAVYAPEPPFDSEEILKIFSQMIRQLANLSHCTSPASANFDLYTKILEDLAEVKIGIVLVELMRSLDPSGTLSQREMMDSDDEMDENDESALREEATEMLCELIKTIIHSVTWEHPAEVYTNAVDAVAACVDEFYQNTPIPILDEVLAPIGAGPTVWVTNPAAVEAAAAIAEQKKKNKKSGKKNAAPINIKMPPSQIQQQNRSYHVAAKVLQKCEDRVAQPVANLLNGLLNGDPKVVDMSNISSADAPPVPRGQDGRSSTADVWDIIFELHKVSSQALTTVIGNLAPLLENEDLDKRIRVTKLLGKLFCSSHSDMANNYRIVFSKWLRRTNDREAKLRSMIVKQIATFMQFKAHERELCEEATKHLIHVMKNDPEQSVRIDAIHAVCDLAHLEKSSGPLVVADPQDRTGDNSGRGYGPVVSAKLLRAVADRVQSKNKDERKDALTGLAQIYYRHYVCEKLKDVQRGGDDCDIAVIMDTLHDTCFFGQSSSATASKKRGKASGRRRGAQREFDEDEDEDMSDSFSYDIDDKYKWIPSLIFKSGFFTDGKDSGMRDRVNQIIDDVILGPYKAVDENDSSGSRKKILTPTSRAVGFSMILDSCRHDDGSLNADVLLQLEGLLVQKSNLQTALKGYIEARSRVKECEAGSEEALTADAEAMEKLREVSNLSSPITGSSDHDDVLQSLHSARDKHIFRILATISSPNHTPSSRQRAFDDLPKRAKSLGNATAAWVKKLARRCAMGGFINEESVATCIQLAQECFQEGDLDCTRVLLTSARAALRIFNLLGANRESFGILVELYGECQSSHVKNKKQIDQAGIPSLLNQMLAIASPQLTLAPSGKKGKGKSNEDDDKYEDELQDMLLRMCTRDSSVEQAQYAVFTLSQLAKKDKDPLAREKEVFEPLLRSLTSPSRLTIDSKGGSSRRILQILAALNTIAQCAPSTFSSPNGRGEKAIKFALESILLGRTANGDESGGSDNSDEENESSDEEGDEESVSTSKSKRRSSQSRRKSTAKPPTNVAANRAKLAVSLLTTHIRSAILASPQANWKVQNKDHIKSVFSVLEQILRDSGLPPSSRDRRECKSSSDRAALRQSAALNIFRLCDPILQLEDEFLSNSCWHLLGDVLTDEEQSVREKVIRKYSDLIAGYGKYCHGNSCAPSLRLLSLTVLCADPENNRNGAVASGNTAVVGKASDLVKARASIAIVNLRKTSDQIRAHCVANGRASEELFDKQFKFQLMPECSLSFSLHLLSFRSETPSKSSDVTNDTTIEEEESDAEDDLNTVARDSAKTKMLRKRLKWLLEPLVQSLGEGANNISFLLRIVDLLGNKWQPINVARNTAGRGESDDDEDTADKTFDTISSLGISLDETTSGYRSAADAKRAQDAQAKLKAACFEAREVLLKFVKKDINLQTYPGGIGFPRNLFELSKKKLPAATASEKAVEAVASPFSAKDSLASPMSSIKKSSAIKSSVQRHAHFSPELESRREFREDFEDDDDDMGGGPFDMDDDDDEVMSTSVRASKASAKTTKTAASSRRKRSSYGSKGASAGDDLPLSNSPSEPRGAKNSFGGMSPIAQSASPASSTPSLASTRSGAKRKQPQATSPAQTETSDLPSQSQSTLGSPESKAASEASPSSAKKRKVKATPVKIKVSRSSTGAATSSAEKSASASKRPARRAKSRGQQKQQKAAVSASKALVDDELDFDDGEDDGFDDAVPTASTKAKTKGKKRTASGGGRKITVSAKGTSKSKGGKNMSPSKNSKGLAKSTLQNKTRRRAKA